MKASVVDMRYKMSEVLDALERSESVEILYHGRTKGIIMPVRRESGAPVKEHAFFGMFSGSDASVDEVMESLRGPRVP